MICLRTLHYPSEELSVINQIHKTPLAYDVNESSVQNVRQSTAAPNGYVLKENVSVAGGNTNVIDFVYLPSYQCIWLNNKCRTVAIVVKMVYALSFSNRQSFRCLGVRHT